MAESLSGRLFVSQNLEQAKNRAEKLHAIGAPNHIKMPRISSDFETGRPCPVSRVSGFATNTAAMIVPCRRAACQVIHQMSNNTYTAARHE